MYVRALLSGTLMNKLRPMPLPLLAGRRFVVDVVDDVLVVECDIQYAVDEAFEVRIDEVVSVHRLVDVGRPRQSGVVPSVIDVVFGGERVIAWEVVLVPERKMNDNIAGCSLVKEAFEALEVRFVARGEVVCLVVYLIERVDVVAAAVRIVLRI